MSDTLVGHFSLWGDFLAEEVTLALDLQPSMNYPKGTIFDGADYPAKTTTWDFYCPDHLAMGEQILYLIDVFWPRADALRRLSEQFCADFNVTGSQAEVFALDQTALSKLASLRVTLNCFYIQQEKQDVN